MINTNMTRRAWLKGAGASLVSAAALHGQQLPPAEQHMANNQEPSGEPPAIDANREERMKWWHAAKFGMFIHWGLYSVHGRHEWAMEDEAIPIDQYMQFARQFKPKPNAPRDFARLAKALDRNTW